MEKTRAHNLRGRANKDSGEHGHQGLSQRRQGTPGRRYGGENQAEMENMSSLPPTKVPMASAQDVEKQENKAVASNQGIGSLSLSDFKLPLRSSYGDRGRPIVLSANYFHLLPDPNLKLYKYNFKVSPRKEKQRIPQRIFTQFLKSPLISACAPGVVIDYNSLMVTSKAVNLGPSGSSTVEFVYQDEQEKKPRPGATHYKFTITQAGFVEIPELLEFLGSTSTDRIANFDKTSTIAALNAIIARTPNITPTTFIRGQNKFFPFPSENSPGAFFSLGGGLIAVRGYYASVRTSTLRVLINVNTQTSAFYAEKNVFDLMAMSKLQEPEKLELFLQKLRVTTSYLKNEDGTVAHKVKSIKRLHPDFLNARQLKFECGDLARKVSVEEYFKRTYKIVLRHPGAVLLDVGTIEATNEKPAMPIYLPPEMCKVMPGQAYTKKLSPSQTSNMIKYAVRPPHENSSHIYNEGLDVVGLGGTASEHLAVFGLKFNPRMISVPGRVLDAPTLKYQNSASRAKDASWNMSGRVLAAPRAVKKWSYFQFLYHKPTGESDEKFDEKLKLFQGHFGTRSPIASLDIKILLVILPNDDAYTYSRIKYLGDVVIGKSAEVATFDSCSVNNCVGFHTVFCLREKFLAATRLDYCANVALKFNLKLGGTNQTIPLERFNLLRTDTMFVGIDVTHPLPRSMKNAPSIAGVVASVDAAYWQWPASIRCQSSRKEMVEYLEAMMDERLTSYVDINKTLPTKIIVYRDGISEGQYETVLAKELPAIQKACKKRYPASRKVKISIIVVGKRHHTRFYPTQDKDGDNKGNPLNGTVVDRGVTMERGFDFFLQAHKALQGTAKPAHYVVIHDENGLSANLVQEVTHSLCYLFGRATKAVSVCPPAYYADLLCERGRCYLYNIFNADPKTLRLGIEYQKKMSEFQSRVNVKIKKSMFYI